MKGLREKFRKHEGFTLVEMLIVVAIIAILIAVSIPLVSNSLDKTRHATDEANERAAKAEIMIQYLADKEAYVDNAVLATGLVKDTPYYYDAINGKLVSAYAATLNYGQHGGHSGACLALKISENGEVSMQWVKATATAAAITNGNLCSGKEVSDTAHVAAIS